MVIRKEGKSKRPLSSPGRKRTQPTPRTSPTDSPTKTQSTHTFEDTKEEPLTLELLSSLYHALLDDSSVLPREVCGKIRRIGSLDHKLRAALHTLLIYTESDVNVNFPDAFSDYSNEIVEASKGTTSQNIADSSPCEIGPLPNDLESTKNISTQSDTIKYEHINLGDLPSSIEGGVVTELEDQVLEFALEKETLATEALGLCHAIQLKILDCLEKCKAISST